MADKNIHSGHRERMRARWRRSGGESFADHELLEMLLFYALPRQNTNDLAHTLIETFGSFSAVLEAGEDRLCSVQGIGENAAHLISLCAESARRYTVGRLQVYDSAPVLVSSRQVADYLRPYYVGVHKERAYLLLFNNSMRLIDCFPVGEGSLVQVQLPMRDVFERVCRKQATIAILAHNHPYGTARASIEDLETTRNVAVALRSMQVVLLEHIIMTDTAFLPIVKNFKETLLSDYETSLLQDVLRQQPDVTIWEG